VNIIREACVETREEINRAASGGADRIELCARLELGGLTPSFEMLEYALSKNLSVAAMIRLKEGFSTNSKDLELMQSAIRAFQKTEVEGFVFGFLTEDRKIDFSALKTLLAESGKKSAVFHMAFDEISESEQFAAIDALSELGFARVLTKGGSGKALDNVERLKALHEYAEGKITILCGGGVTDENYKELALKTGITQFHGRKLALK
jgi:copper homeostasis protein